MKKRIIMIAGVALLLGVMLASCYSTSHNTCPAYRGAQTSHYRR